MKDKDELLDLAFEYLEGPQKNVNKAIELFEPLALEGDVTAQFALGEIYWNGDSQVPQNNEKAIFWYSLAGENGHPLVQLWLGNNYCIGIRTNPDSEKAVYWYEKAATNNVVLAQYHLGICYHTGWGIIRDDEKAFLWMSKAASQNFLEAELFVSEAYKSGIGVSKDFSKYRHLSKAIEERYVPIAPSKPDIALSLAKAFLDGNGVEHNPELAVKILSDPCLDGQVEVMILLAECYEKGIGVSKNIELSFQILRKISGISDVARNKMKLLSIKYDLTY